MDRVPTPFRRAGPFTKFTASFARAEGGNVAVIFAVVSIVLIGAIGVAVDYSRMALTRSQLQDRLDAALIAGVQGQGTTTAETFFDNTATGSIAKSVSRSFTSESDGLSGTASAAVPTTLSGVLGLKSFDVSASGKAVRPSGGSACILVNSTTANQAFLANSGATINAPDCEIHVRSTANPAAIVNSGVTLNVKRVCIAGTNIIKNSSATMPIETGCAAATDTIGPTLPSPPAQTACTVLDQNATTFNLKPGTYCSFNFNGGTKVNLAPGFYTITGTINVSGSTFTGSGVTLYFANAGAQIHFNASVVKTLTAPTSGTYKDILVYENQSNALSNYTWDSGPTDTLSGIIYLARRNVTFNSQTNIKSHALTMVVNTLIWNDTRWNLSPGPVLLGSGAGGTARLTH
ncbi:MAG: pilus assembly protein [Rhizobiales bacterium]|nr:pilus assembly protein [Hyphomicrobiales bacterium]